MPERGRDEKKTKRGVFIWKNTQAGKYASGYVRWGHLREQSSKYGALAQPPEIANK